MFLDITPDPVGIPEAKFIKCVDKLINERELNPEILEYMNQHQLFVMWQINKHNERKKRQESKEQSDKD